MLPAKESCILRNAPVAAGASMILAEQSPQCVMAEGLLSAVLEERETNA